MVGMSKEEKAAEMVRRREERKQVCSFIFFFQSRKTDTRVSIENRSSERAEEERGKVVVAFSPQPIRGFSRLSGLVELSCVP